MMVKLKEQGHRVLICTQFQHMLDLFEDYCNCKKWLYERIDGKVLVGAKDKFRLKGSMQPVLLDFAFCCLPEPVVLVNLATADTVIIYDSDWNPHVDLQMACGHRLRHKNKALKEPNRSTEPEISMLTSHLLECQVHQMFEKKLMERTSSLEQQWAAERAARLKAEEDANANKKKADEEIRYIKEQIEIAKKGPWKPPVIRNDDICPIL